MNRVFLIGNLTREPELKSTPNGVNVCTFSLAVNRRFNKDITDFFTVVAWRGLAELCAKYVGKGNKVAVLGEIQTRSYEKDGYKRYITEIHADEIEFLSKAEKGMLENVLGGEEVKEKNPFDSGEDLVEIDLEDEELPF